MAEFVEFIVNVLSALTGWRAKCRKLK